MIDFMQFGWDAAGFMIAAIVASVVVGTVGSILFGAIQSVANWCDKNGWNG